VDLTPLLAFAALLFLNVPVTVAIGAGALLPVPLRLLARYRYSWALSAMALVALTLVAGREASPGGPRLWLELGGLSFQPAEPLKLVLVIFLAGYLEDKQDLLARGSWKLGALRLIPWPYLAPLAVMLGSSLLLLAVQRDLGAALLLYGIGLGLLYVASLRISYVLLGLSAFVLGAAELHLRMPVVRTRLAIWLDPWADAQGFGYQVVQSLLAVAGGGFLGSGLGLGQPTVIPAVHTDFVFAAIAEELGLAGATAVLLVYAILGLRGLRAALRANGVSALLAAGIAIALTLQALIIMAGVVKLIPLTGITLPFLSYGGTSLITSAFMLGLLLRAESEP
jgi:cell division protein FtsW (lipid II flippase)